MCFNYISSDIHFFNNFMGREEYHCIRMEKARQLFKAQEEYFVRNGAMLLEKQITCNRGRDTEPIKIFSAKDIQ